MQQADWIGAIQKSRLTALQVGVMVTCWFINMLDGFDVLAIAFTAPTISAEWHLEPGTLGVVLSAGLIGMALGALFIAPLADRFGRRTIILWCLAVIGSAMLLTAAVDTVALLIVMRLVTGLGVGGLLASLNTMVAEYAPRRSRNFAISFLQSGYAIGGLAGGVVAAWLIPAFGWQAVFIAGGLATLIMVMVVLMLMPESLHYLVERRTPGALAQVNRILPRLGQSQLAELPAGQEKGAAPGIREIFAPDLKASTLLLWLSFFMSMLTLYFLLLWTPQIIVNAGLPTSQGIFVGVILNVGGLVGMLLLGYLSERFGLYRLIVAFFLLAAVSMVAFALIEASPVVLLVLAFVLGFFTVGGMIGLYSAAAAIYPTMLRSTGLGWGIGIGRLGAILGPNIAGALIGIGWEQADYFLLLALPLLFAAISTLALSRSLQSRGSGPFSEAA
jgi:MFS transporter, AAHS family, 4-hydroxybenzoate transporter